MTVESTEYIVTVRGTSRSGDIVASGLSRDDIARQVRRAYGRGAFLEIGHTVLGSGMREGMILRQVGRESGYSVLENVIVYRPPVCDS